MSDQFNNEEPWWKSLVLTWAALALVFAGFGVFGNFGTVTGQAAGDGSGTVGCGGSDSGMSAYYNEDTGELVEPDDMTKAKHSDGEDSEGKNGDGLAAIEPVYISPDLRDGLVESDFATQVSVAPSGMVVIARFEGVSEENQFASHFKLLELDSEDGETWRELGTFYDIDLGLDELSELADTEPDEDTQVYVLEAHQEYVAIWAGGRVLKYSKEDEDWATLDDDEMKPYLAEVVRSPERRLAGELNYLRPVSMGSLAIEQTLASLKPDGIKPRVTNYGYVATKAIAVSLDTGAAVIVPDCGLGYRIIAIEGRFACEECPINAYGEADCSYGLGRTLLRERDIPKPDDNFFRYHQVFDDLNIDGRHPGLSR